MKQRVAKRVREKVEVPCGKKSQRGAFKKKIQDRKTGKRSFGQT